MKVAVISGASSGIGREIALLLKHEYQVYDLSRSGQDEPGILHIDTDVTEEESVKAAFAQLEAREGKIDLLICNAGYGIAGAAEFTPLCDAKRQMDVNFFGTVLCCQYALPLLRASHGRILAISSAAATFPIPFQSFYSASKAAINAYICALRNEVRSMGITASAILPGDTKTGFTAARKKETDGEGIYGGRIASSIAVMEKDEEKGMKPESVARTVVRIAKKRRVRPLYTAGFSYKLLTPVERLLGTTLVNRLIGILYVKKPKGASHGPESI